MVMEIHSLLMVVVVVEVGGGGDTGDGVGGWLQSGFHGNRIPAKRSHSEADLEKHKRIMGDLAPNKKSFSFTFHVFFCHIGTMIKEERKTEKVREQKSGVKKKNTAAEE